MGQAANNSTTNKVNWQASDNLVHLHDEIAAKRARLSNEIGDLRRRQHEAVRQVRKYGAVIAVSAVAIFCAGSLINAVVDLVSTDEEEPQTKNQQTITHTLSELAWSVFKVMAIRYVQDQLRSKQSPTPTGSVAARE